MLASEFLYNDLEDLLIESLDIINKNKNFLDNKKNREIFYENSLLYCRLKLERLENFKYSYKEKIVFPKILKESISDKKYQLLKEQFLDKVKDIASSALEKAKEWTGNVVDFAQKSPVAFAQGIADIVSIFDPTGLVDLINGSIYLARGEKLYAFFCAIGAAFTLPGFISSLTGVGAIAGVPMIAIGKTLKGILRVGGKITGPIIKAASKILKSGGVITKLVEIASKLPGLKTFVKFFEEMAPKFVKAADAGGEPTTILSKVFGTADNVVKAPGKLADQLVAKGTAITGEKAASKVGFEVAKGKFGKAMQVGGAGLLAYHMGSHNKDEEVASAETPTEDSGEENEEENAILDAVS